MPTGAGFIQKEAVRTRPWQNASRCDAPLALEPQADWNIAIGRGPAQLGPCSQRSPLSPSRSRPASPTGRGTPPVAGKFGSTFHPRDDPGSGRCLACTPRFWSSFHLIAGRCFDMALFFSCQFCAFPSCCLVMAENGREKRRRKSCNPSHPISKSSWPTLLPFACRLLAVANAFPVWTRLQHPAGATATIAVALRCV